MEVRHAVTEVFLIEATKLVDMLHGGLAKQADGTLTHSDKAKLDYEVFHLYKRIARHDKDLIHEDVGFRKLLGFES